MSKVLSSVEEEKKPVFKDNNIAVDMWKEERKMRNGA